MERRHQEYLPVGAVQLVEVLADESSGCVSSKSSRPEDVLHHLHGIFLHLRVEIALDNFHILHSRLVCQIVLDLILNNHNNLLKWGAHLEELDLLLFYV